MASMLMASMVMLASGLMKRSSVQYSTRARSGNATVCTARNLSRSMWIISQNQAAEGLNYASSLEMGLDHAAGVAGGGPVRLHRDLGSQRGYRAHPVLYLRRGISGAAGAGARRRQGGARALAIWFQSPRAGNLREFRNNMRVDPVDRPMRLSCERSFSS